MLVILHCSIILREKMTLRGIKTSQYNGIFTDLGGILESNNFMQRGICLPPLVGSSVLEVLSDTLDIFVLRNPFNK